MSIAFREGGDRSPSVEVGIDPEHFSSDELGRALLTLGAHGVESPMLVVLSEGRRGIVGGIDDVSDTERRELVLSSELDGLSQFEDPHLLG